MGDILIHLASRMLRLLGLWSCGDCVSDLHQIPRPAGPSVQRTRAEPALLRVDVAQFDIGITHPPVTALGLEDADRLADQCLTDKDQLARPFDLTVAAHAAHCNVLAIGRIRDPIRVGPRRRLIQQSRRLLSQRLVRPLRVVDRTEVVEPLLLCRQTGGRRRCRLLVERAVYPLVPAILLRLAGPDPLGPDAQLDPPHRQPRQSADPGRGKRRAVIRTDRLRQAMLLEGRREDRPHILLVGPRHRLTAQQVTAVRVGQGKRITAPAVGGAEPPLEIGAPHVVGRAHCRKRLGIRRTPPTLAQPAGHTLASQPLPDRAGRRHRQLGMVLGQLHPQLLWPPVWPALAQSQHRLHHGNVMRLAVLQRRVRALRQTRGALRDIPAEPLVAGLSADPILPAQHRHLILARQNPSDKLYSLVHLTGRSPRHRQVPPAGSSNLSPIQPVNSVTYLLGPYTLPNPPPHAGEGNHYNPPPQAGEGRVGVEAERRQLTVMFCDLVGSTALSVRFDPEELREEIRAYQNAVSGVVARYDGFVAKYMGDGVLAYFGYPRAHEDDAERAVRAGLEIAAAVSRLETRGTDRLAVRIGIATGLVVVGDLVGEGSAQEQAVVGETPNLAARLQAVAEPGQIVIASATRRLVGDLFRLTDLGRQVAKGFAEPVEAFAVEGVAVTESRFEAVRRGISDFVGRAAESVLLRDRLREAWSGAGQIVLLSGEAGIGKSRLAARLAAEVV